MILLYRLCTTEKSVERIKIWKRDVYISLARNRQISPTAITTAKTNIARCSDKSPVRLLLPPGDGCLRSLTKCAIYSQASSRLPTNNIDVLFWLFRFVFCWLVVHWLYGFHSGLSECASESPSESPSESSSESPSESPSEISSESLSLSAESHRTSLCVPRLWMPPWRLPVSGRDFLGKAFLKRPFEKLLGKGFLKDLSRHFLGKAFSEEVTNLLCTSIRGLNIPKRSKAALKSKSSPKNNVKESLLSTPFKISR